MGACELHSTLQDLVEKKADVDTIRTQFILTYAGDPIFYTVLVSAAIQYDHKPLLLDLLRSNTADDDLIYPFPVLMAIDKDDYDLFKLLIQYGADIHVGTSMKHNSGGSWSFVKSEDPLTVVVRRDDVTWLSRLLPHYQAEKSRTNLTPLLLACRHNSPQCLAHLLSLPEVSANINAVDQSRPTPLAALIASEKCTAQTVETLLKHGADPCLVIPNTGGYAPLHQLAHSQGYNAELFMEVANVLLEAGADVTAETEENDSVVDVLVKSLRTIVDTSWGPHNNNNNNSPDTNYATVDAEQKCNNVIRAVRFLLDIDDEMPVSRSLDRLVSGYYRMYLNTAKFQSCENATCSCKENFVKDLPTVLSALETLILEFLGLGADPNDKWCCENCRRLFPENATEEALFVIAEIQRRQIPQVEQVESALEAIQTHLMVIACIFIQRTHTPVNPRQMIRFLTADLPTSNILLLDIYLDSLPLADQRNYLRDTVKLTGGDADDEDDPSDNVFTHRRERVISLRYLCRFCIRCAIGTVSIADDTVKQLPIPDSLQRYIRHPLW